MPVLITSADHQQIHLKASLAGETSTLVRVQRVGWGVGAGGGNILLFMWQIEFYFQGRIPEDLQKAALTTQTGLH